MNIPNQLTITRLGLTALFVTVIEVGFPWAFTIALVLFLAASFTDYLDGELARRRKLITDFGKLMDPLADKILVAAAFILLVQTSAIPAWVVIIVISREFLITGLRTLASAKGKILPAEKLGKHKTMWQIATITFFLFILALQEWMPYTQPSLVWAETYIGTFLWSVMLILTIYSGAGYLWKNRDLIQIA